MSELATSKHDLTSTKWAIIICNLRLYTVRLIQTAEPADTHGQAVHWQLKETVSQAEADTLIQHTKHTSRVDGCSCTNRWKHSCDSSSCRTGCWCLPSVIDELTGMACTCTFRLQESVFMVRYTDMQTDWHGSPTSHPYSVAHSGSPQYYTCSMYWVFV